MGNVLNIIGRFNDLVIPRSSSGDAPVEFEVIPGQQIEVKSDLMNMLEELAVNATDVPLELIQMRNSPEYATHLTMTNTKFLQKVYNRQSKTQKMFGDIITTIYNYEFNDGTDNHDEIIVELPPPLYLAATNTSSIASAIVDVSNIAAAAYVDENDAVKLGAVRRKFQQEMMGSLFPVGMMERVLDSAELEMSKEKSNPAENQAGGGGSDYE
jgi:hypothetical protein